MGLEKVWPTGSSGVRAPKVTDFPVPIQKALGFGEGLKKEARGQHEKRGVDQPAPAPSRIKEIRFTLGVQGRPAIRHDHGFLDDGNGNIDIRKRRAPTAEDRLLLAKWIAKLEVAEAVRPDLVDGTTTYRHFLFGRGMKRTLNYERFVQNDSSGQRALGSAIEDTATAALEFHLQRLPFSPSKPIRDSFRFQSQVISVGGSDLRYPYPATENWQKAIGAHFIWLDAAATVNVNPSAKVRSLDVQMTLHAEDMYNFNPGAVDIATHTPDAENGRFELCGLGHEYLNTAILTRSLSFKVPFDFKGDFRKAAHGVSAGRAGRTTAPSDARR